MVKLITESLSPVSTIALIYSFSAMIILVLNGIPHFQHMSKAYLWGGDALFVAYEILFLLSVALSQNHEQVLIVAMINYLSPTLTIVFSILAKQLNYHWPVIIGFVISVLGLSIYPSTFEEEG